MAEYPPPPPNTGFALTPPFVYVVRHVRVVLGSGEVVAEDGATLVRRFVRLNIVPRRSGHGFRMTEDHPPMRVHQ
jgi:hypothetical protein